MKYIEDLVGEGHTRRQHALERRSVLRTVRKPGAEGIIEYTKRIFDDPRLSNLIVPLGDGMAISFRIR